MILQIGYWINRLLAKRDKKTIMANRRETLNFTVGWTADLKIVIRSYQILKKQKTRKPYIIRDFRVFKTAGDGT